MGIIKKAVNTVAVSANGNDNFAKFFRNRSLKYYQKEYSPRFFVEHFNAVKSIIKLFTGYGGIQKNHVILHAPTQSGKTSVMTLLYNVVNESFLKEILKIKKIIYITGDNQIALSDQSMDRFWKQCSFSDYPIRLSGKECCKAEDYQDRENEWKKTGRTPFIMIRNNDCKKFKNVFTTLNNTLLMVDESHYGTKEESSQLNQLFQNFGKDFSGDPQKLVKQNTYILSVSATPYNEEYADKVNNHDELLKGIVYYKPGNGYMGFKDLYEKGMVEGLSDNNIARSKEDFKNFLEKEREKMDAILKKEAKRCAIIMRMQGSKTLLKSIGEKGLKKIAAKYGFKLNIITSGKTNIDYEGTYDLIRMSQNKGGENILTIVKQGFSYGISIPDDIKPLIATIYDFRPDVGSTTTDSTEQGLLRRMTGYHPNKLNEYLKIYIAQNHLDGLVAYHVNIPPADSPNPIKERKAKIECSFEEWNSAVYHPSDKKTADDVKKLHIELWNNSKREPLIFNGKVVDDFFARHTDFDYDALFETGMKAKIGTITKIAEVFNKEVMKGRFNFDLLVDARRQIGDKSQNDQICQTLGFVTPILSNSSRKGWREAENAGKEGWAFIIDLRNRKCKKGIEIRIPYGNIGFSKDVVELKQRVAYDGYMSKEIKAECTYL